LALLFALDRFISAFIRAIISALLAIPLERLRTFSLHYMARTCETIKITKRHVDAATPLLERNSPRQRLYLDTALRGFGCCVGRDRQDVFRSKTVRGRSVRVTTGGTAEFTLTKRGARHSSSSRRWLGLGTLWRKKRKARARGFTLSQRSTSAWSGLKSKGRSASRLTGPLFHRDHLKDWLTGARGDYAPGRAARHQKIAADVAAGRFAKGRRVRRSTAPHGELGVGSFRAVYNAAAREHPELHPARP